MESLDMKQPNAIIFRLPDDDEGNKIFCEVLIGDDGKLGEDAQAFGVDDEDSFNDLEYSSIVLALKESEDSSMELATFDVMDQVTGEPAEVWHIMGSLDQVVPGLVEAYLNGAGHTKQ